MTLTLGQGPLAADAVATVNYRVDGPEHRLLLHDFPRRVRGVFAGETVVDTTRAKVLHETNYLPQLYVPVADVRVELLESTGHTTHCPFKGDASYWTIRVGDRTADNAVWAYEQPIEEASWLHGYQAVYFDAMDAWFDEDEEIAGHFRDPYHRVDVRATSRRVRVRVADDVVAETDRAMLLSETGLPNRYYLPADDVRRDLLEPSATHTVCPYKGTASYHTLRLNGRRLTDAVWVYPEPLEDAGKIAGYLCYGGDGVVVEVDGEPVE